ncbi:MAG: hypothetical protein ACYCYM_13835 [Saccharofermentanales bacterium]
MRNCFKTVSGISQIKRLLAIVTVLVFMISIPSINVDLCALSEKDVMDISVISTDPDLKHSIISDGSKSTCSYNIKIIEEADVDIGIADETEIWVDIAFLKQSAIKNKLIQSYSKGKRIIILGEGQNRKEMLEYFGEDTTNTYEVLEKPREVPENTNYQIIAMKCIGTMIYKKNGIINTTSIYSDENIDEVYNLLLYVTEYDYIGLAMGQQNTKKFFSTAEVSAEPNNTWNSVKVATRTDSCTRFILNMSLKIDKNSGNPNNAGQYLYYSVLRTDIDVKPYSGSDLSIYRYSIAKANIENTGRSIAAIYDYSPHNRNSSSANVSVSLPWGISASFDPETRIKITKTSGGIDSNNIGIEYKAVNWLGFQAYVYDSMWCEAHYEAFQNSCSFQTTSDYLITTYEMEFYDGSPVNGISYYPATVFTIGGT